MPSLLLRATIGFFTLASVVVNPARGEDWPRFRGPGGAGVSQSTGLPVEFGPEKNVAWKVDSGRGTSSPIVIGGQLYYTSFEGDRRTVHCVDAATGGSRWTRSYEKVREEVGTPPCGPATPTPVADEDHVFAFFPDTGLFCFSHRGQELWRVDFEPFYAFHGIASSLIIAGGNVVLVVDQLKDSFMAVYDAKSGDQIWKVERLNGTVGGYSTPLAYKAADGKQAIVAAGPLELVAYDAHSGDRLWWLNGVTNAPISVPVLSGDRLYVCEPYYEGNPFKIEDIAPYDKNKDGRIAVDELEAGSILVRLVENIDRQWGNGDGAIDGDEMQKAFGGYVGSGGLVAVDPSGAGDVSKTHVRWTYRKSAPQIPSVLHYQDVIYLANDGGVLVTIDPATGKLLKRERLNDSGRKYEASPVAADGRVYLLDADGKMAVVTAGRPWKLAATNDLGEPCHATPAIADGRLYVRTQKSLYCFAASADGDT